MKRFTFVLAIVALAAADPVPSHAQTGQNLPVVAASQDPPPQAQQRKPPPPPPPSEDRPRRRGSMVGYIDDAIIESQVRVRFETGFGNRAPDRAEFFYAKCGCYTVLDQVDGAERFFDPDAPGPGVDVVTDLDFQQVLVEGEYAVGDRFAVFGELPIRWIQAQSLVNPRGGPPVGLSDQGGIGDLRGGVKFGLASAADYAVTFKLQAYFPTGDAGDGLGTDHASFEPVVLYHHRANERFAVESQFGFWLSAGGSDGPDTPDDYAGNVLVYGIGPSYVLYESSTLRIAPVVELVGWHVLDGFEAPPGTVESDASGTDIVNLKFGARLLFEPRSSIYVGYGHALTDESWYDDIFRVEYRYTF